MKEELLQKLTEYMTGTKDFFLENAPDFFQQMLAYEKTSTIFAITILSMLFLGCLLFSIYCFTNPCDDRYSIRELFKAFSIIGCCAFFAALCFNIDTLIKIKIAPKYYIISSLIGKMKS